MATDPVSIANVPYWPWLPMGMTNYGGDTQIFTIDPQSYAPIGCMFNPQAQLAANGWYNQPIFNNWGINNPYSYNLNQGYGYYC